MVQEEVSEVKRVDSVFIFLKDVYYLIIFKSFTDTG